MVESAPPHQSVVCLFLLLFAQRIFSDDIIFFVGSKILAGNSPGGPPNDVEKPEFLFEEQDFKGMLSEALVEAMNKILIAFDCRQIKKHLERQHMPCDTDISNDE